MVSYECGAADSKQLHLCSTCVLNGSKSCRVIRALYQAEALKPREAAKPGGG